MLELDEAGKNSSQSLISNLSVFSVVTQNMTNIKYRQCVNTIWTKCGNLFWSDAILIAVNCCTRHIKDP